MCIVLYLLGKPHGSLFGLHDWLVVPANTYIRVIPLELFNLEEGTTIVGEVQGEFAPQWCALMN